MTDLNNLLKQAQQMQEKMQKAQEEQAKVLVTGESGAGLVKVTMNGKYEVKHVALDPSLLQEEKSLVEDLIAAAFNAAANKINEGSRSAMSGMAAGLNLPPGFKLPF